MNKNIRGFLVIGFIVAIMSTYYTFNKTFILNVSFWVETVVQVLMIFSLLFLGCIGESYLHYRTLSKKSPEEVKAAIKKLTSFQFFRCSLWWSPEFKKNLFN